MISKLLTKFKEFTRPSVAVTITCIKPEDSLKNKVALISGGTNGIGKAIAKNFIEAGAFVIITGRTEEKAKSVAATIGVTEQIRGASLDIRKVEDFSNKIEYILNNVLPEGKKRIDILVNSAGILGGDIRNTSKELYDDVMDTNLRGAFFLSKVVADHMIENKIHGNILNIASSSSLRPAISAYTLSKWGIAGLTKGFAKMLAPHKITVNGLAPGPTATAMLGKQRDDDLSHPNIPLGRYILAEEIAQMANVLVGPIGKSIIGDIIYMTGGAGIIDFNDLDYSYNL